ncbi:MAG: beta-propeller fold lactonase family protein, partial [Acidobacteria bacterium]|nr:beta-propeller fold lactonase family protein [Acidobacteriota bacterium]
MTFRSPMPSARTLRLLPVLLAFMAAAPLHAAGARLYKSGPIQITADGAFVWVANGDNDSVSRITTATDAVLEVPLPDPGTRHSPRGLAVTDDGSQVWVACLESDRVYVLSGSDGTELTRIDLPWGTGPYSVVLAPPATGGVQPQALVTGYRGERLVVLDVATRSVAKVLEPVWRSPMGATFTADGDAWVTHLFADGEHTRISRVDFSDPQDPKVTAFIRVTPVQPQSSVATAPRRAEGGYVTPRGHPAQVPGVQDQGRVWIPTEYQNIHEDDPSPDSTVQAVIRKLNLTTRHLDSGGNHPSNPAHPAKVILSAVDVHDPTRPGNNPLYEGPGWNAQVSGAIDVAFSADGTTAYVAFEQSEDVVVMATSTPPIKPAASPPLTEIPVGRRPMGIVASPASDLVYVSNFLSRTVSVVDPASGSELRQIAITPVTGEPLSAEILRGAEIFHSSNEDALSHNRKVACASCHFNAEQDGRIWELQHLPGNHGPRHTQLLLGLSATFGPVDPTTGWGQLHRSGDRDEVQDFEHTLQGPQMGGDGFLGAGVQPELGPANAGRSADLDALAAYVLSLPAPGRSPFRAPDGSLTEAALRGATFFLGTGTTLPADAGCAACHLPTQGFSDQRFHDVGQGVRNGENELNNRSPSNHVNTPGLLGLWTSAPYVGVVGFAETFRGALEDFRNRPGARAPHGRLGGLTGRQMRDLEAFLLSLDGNTTPAEVLAASDTEPPKIVRAEPASLTRLDVWFDESVDAASAEVPAAWEVREVAGGQVVTVLAASLDPQNADRVTLTLAGLSAGCTSPRAYEVRALGPILDLADSAGGGLANSLVNGPPTGFEVGTELTLTLGASGYENLTVAVHDASTLPGLTTWSHGGVWIFPNGSTSNTGFVRFDWSPTFHATTGVTDSSDLLAASFSVSPTMGDSQTLEARRVLQEWFDHRGGDFNSNPVDPDTGHGGPTWRDSEHGVRAWNGANASATATGVEGDAPGDYHGPWDLAHTPEAVVPMTAINERTVIGGPGITAAYRFFFDNPSFDHGHALRLAAGSANETRFEGVEQELMDHGPVLTLTYRLPISCTGLFADGFESGDTSAW